MKSKKLNSKIEHTGLRCKLCGDVIFSEYTHDFKECSCGNCFVDGGKSYFRRGYSDPDTVETIHRLTDGSILEDIT